MILLYEIHYAFSYDFEVETIGDWYARNGTIAKSVQMLYLDALIVMQV